MPALALAEALGRGTVTVSVPRSKGEGVAGPYPVVAVTIGSQYALGNLPTCAAQRVFLEALLSAGHKTDGLPVEGCARSAEPPAAKNKEAPAHRERVRVMDPRTEVPHSRQDGIEWEIHVGDMQRVPPNWPGDPMATHVGTGRYRGVPIPMPVLYNENTQQYWIPPDEDILRMIDQIRSAPPSLFP